MDDTCPDCPNCSCLDPDDYIPPPYAELAALAASVDSPTSASSVPPARNPLTNKGQK